MNDDRLLDAHEAAQLLHVPVTWIRARTRDGLLPHVELGRYRRYRRGALLAWIDAHEAGGAAWGKHHPKTSAAAAPRG